MGAFSKAKGARGEREAVQLLNGTIERVITQNAGWDADVVNAARACVQRNQNQSAVGGHDLDGVFGMSVEIKRHETLHVEQWWKQTLEQAARNKEHPVLLYRQNKQKWTCVTLGHVTLPGGRQGTARITLDEDAFSVWFYQWVYYKMIEGDLPRV